jgi:hypothetical protein
MNEHAATAQNGPLAGQWGLTVADQDPEGRWPSPVVWRSGASRHVYDLMALAAYSDAALEPVYAFRRTLQAGEVSPEATWTVPPHYLM